MATPRDSSKQLFAAVSRLTGAPVRQANHGAFFRVKVTSADGHQHAVTLEVSTHRKVPSKATMNDLADRWRLPRSEIDHVLEEWRADDLIAHLSGLTREELMDRTPVMAMECAAL